MVFVVSRTALKSPEHRVRYSDMDSIKLYSSRSGGIVITVLLTVLVQ